MTVVHEVAGTARALLEYCRARDWKGYDPYDALNSPVFTLIPCLDSRLPRLAATQLLKRSPWNLRRLLLIPETQNPKALALFVTALLRLSRHADVAAPEVVDVLIERLVAQRAPHSAYWCWGYSFPWQTRRDLVRRGAPNLVCTTFVATALLDAYERTPTPSLLGMAASAGEYLVEQLYWTDGFVDALAYPTRASRTPVHNANLLGAALLCRLAAQTGDDKFLAPALRVARYSAGRQRNDGSWPYADSSAHGWSDNFHTGYNLCALRAIGEHTGTSEFEAHVRRGFDFYRRHFFRSDGAPKYFHDRVYPLDVHSAAQSIITLLALDDLDADNVRLATLVYRWTMRQLWDRRGYFGYQGHRLYTNRISFMRWSQAWMLLALSSMLDHEVPHRDEAEARVGTGRA